MEGQCSPLNWDFLHEDEGMEELWDSLLHKTLELETRVASAKEEITKKEDELATLKHFLCQAVRERDEAESKCRSIMLDIVTLQQPKESLLLDQVTSFEPPDDQSSPSSPSTLSELPPAAEKLAEGKPLPEKGKLLQAVMEAGPILQTILLAGPLPQWQHPPPRLDTLEIPLVDIQAFSRQDYSCLSHKRSLPQYSESSDFPSKTKFQKVALY